MKRSLTCATFCLLVLTLIGTTHANAAKTDYTADIKPVAGLKRPVGGTDGGTSGAVPMAKFGFNCSGGRKILLDTHDTTSSCSRNENGGGVCFNSAGQVTASASCQNGCKIWDSAGNAATCSDTTTQ